MTDTEDDIMTTGIFYRPPGYREGNPGDDPSDHPGRIVAAPEMASYGPEWPDDHATILDRSDEAAAIVAIRYARRMRAERKRRSSPVRTD